METTLTICKNNLFSRRATARRFHNRAQLCAEEQEVVSTVVHVVFKNLSSFTFPYEARAAGYAGYGDNEIRARRIERIEPRVYHADQDWANPGFQSKIPCGYDPLKN